MDFHKCQLAQTIIGTVSYFKEESGSIPCYKRHTTPAVHSLIKAQDGLDD